MKAGNHDNANNAKTHIHEAYKDLTNVTLLGSQASAMNISVST